MPYKDPKTKYIKEKIYREKHEKKLSEYQKKYRSVNREKLLDFKKEYYKKNKKSINLKSKQYREKNPEKTKDIQLKLKYGISLDKYNMLLEKQKGVCKICLEKEKAVDKLGKIINLSVDHCHKTGLVRALLCGNCNKGLGAFKDSKILLKRALKYLEKMEKIIETIKLKLN